MKKISISLLTLLAGMMASVAFSSCSSDDDDGGEPTTWSHRNFIIENAALRFSQAGVWFDADRMSPDNVVKINGVSYSRFYNPAQGSMYGFQPSQVTDSVVTVAGTDGLLRAALGYKPQASNHTYMTARYDMSESTSSIPLSPSCALKMVDGTTFLPMSVTISNNAVTYAAMKNGLGQEAFTRTGKCELKIYGISKGERKGPVTVTLGQGTSDGFEGVSTWKKVDINTLGYCESIYFQMESTAGSATPPYFCLLSLEAWAY